MIEWNATPGPGFIFRRAIRIGESVSRVSMLVGNRRNRRESKASGLSLTSWLSSLWMWSGSEIRLVPTRPTTPRDMSEPRCGVARKTTRLTNGRGSKNR